MRQIKFMFLFIALGGFLVLNYGFANWVMPIFGLRLPLGHVLTLIALLLALPGNINKIIPFLKEPAIILWGLLCLLSLGHLFFDLRNYGAYAARDASFVAEGGFLFLGYLWAQKGEDQALFLKGMAGIFLITFIYSLTVLRPGIMAAYSPVSGIFQPVPVLGNYSFIFFGLHVGALFYALVIPPSKKWRNVLLATLAVLLIASMFYFQSRSTYLSVIVIILIIFIFSGIYQALRLSAFHIAGFITLITFAFLLGLLGVKIQGRAGEVTPAFYVEHIETVNPDNNLPNVSGTSWRLDIWRQAVNHWLASPTTIVVGEGFGQPLTNYRQAGGYTGNAVPENTIDPQQFSVAVRQPHNVNLTVLARLGLIGALIWIGFHVRILYLFIHSLQERKKENRDNSVGLWLFLFYVLGMILATVQPWLEFSYGAIPFYIILGFAISILSNSEVDKGISHENRHNLYVLSGEKTYSKENG
jgi:O-antigen ligase